MTKKRILKNLSYLLMTSIMIAGMSTGCTEEDNGSLTGNSPEPEVSLASSSDEILLSSEVLTSSEALLSSSMESTELSSSLEVSDGISSMDMSQEAMSSTALSASLSSTALSSQAKLIRYTTDIAPILNAHCTNCHGSAGGVSLKNYNSAKNKADRILIRTENGTMPKSPNPLLSSEQIQLIKDWIDAGTPE